MMDAGCGHRSLDDQDSAALLLEQQALRAFEVKRVSTSGTGRVMDTVAVEEPLDIRLSYRFKDSVQVESLALAMRTPGHDRELIAGLLLSEAIIANASDLLEIRALGMEPSNEMVAELAPHVDVEAWRLGRNITANASCGVCGKRSREALPVPSPGTNEPSFSLNPAALTCLPLQLTRYQRGFAKTGGLHAAALVNNAGGIESVFEDIGRHNALDKLLGHCLLNGRIPLTNQILFLSSRSSFELVQKTAMAGGKVLATVGGPSSLAIETARQFGITLIGFLREHRFNIYSGDWRINLRL